MRRLLRPLATIVAALCLALPLAAMTAAPARAAVQDFEFESYSADYFVGRDASGHATLRTVETFVARFPDFDQNRGMIRAIPNDYDGVPLRTSVDSVVDENGDPVPYEQSVGGGFTELALGTDDYVHGRTTYTISYSQLNVVRAFADTSDDEFYWDTNGTGFAQPFGSVTARVHVDPSLTEFLTGDTACYRGAEGSNDRCEITQATDAGGELFTAAARDLSPGENVTVVVAFTLGTFVQVPPEDQPGESFPFLPGQTEAPFWLDGATLLTFLLIVLAPVVTIVSRFVKPAASKGSGIIIPQYTVPKDLNLLEAAEIAGRSGSGVAAQIVSFAVRGKIRILDYPVTERGARYTLQLLEADGLDETELDLMRALFGSLTTGAVQEVGVVDDSAASAITRVTGAVKKQMVARGLMQKRSSLIGVIAALALFLLAFVSMGLFMAGIFFNHPSGWGIVGFMLAIFGIFACLIFAARPPVATASGAVHRDYLLGMRDYLKLAEADRFRMLQSPEGAERVRAEGLDITEPAQRVKLYEKLLPFAVLWGVEREWAGELTILYGGTAPDWFVSTGSFNATGFSSALGTLSSTTIARSTPRVSSSGSSWSGSGGGSFSGGSSGGGFSGGGGGGGGGGGR